MITHMIRSDFSLLSFYFNSQERFSQHQEVKKVKCFILEVRLLYKSGF